MAFVDYHMGNNATMPEKLLQFIHMSDTHIHADPDFTGSHNDFSSREPVQALINTINNLEIDIDFVLHTGDVADQPKDPQHYQIAKDILDKIQYPTYYVPGNHDNVAMFQSAFLGIEDDYILESFDYELEINGVQLIMLDSHRPAEEQGAHGYMTDSQLSWLDNLLSKPDTRPLVVSLHHHPLPSLAPWLDHIVLKNGAELHNILRKAQTRLRGVFYGHIHESVVTVRDGISYYSSQSAWFQTHTWYGAENPERDFIHNPGFNLVTLTDTDTFVRFRRIAL